jgi:hypothetical protein
VFAVSFGPCVRSRVHSEATARHLNVRVGRVGLAWNGVRLRDVTVQPRGVEGVEVRIPDARVVMGFFRVSRVEVRGGEVSLSGKEDTLRDSLKRWREESTPATPTRPEPKHRVVTTVIDGMAVRWDDGSAAPRLDLRGLGITRDTDGVRVTVNSARGRLGPADAALSGAALSLNPDGKLTRARAASLSIDWAATAAERAQDDAPDHSSRSEVGSGPPDPRNAGLGPADPRNTASGPADPHNARTARNTSRALAPRIVAAEASAPILPLPDLHGARVKATALAALLDERVAPGADVGVDALTWKFTRPSDRTALTIGPGPFAVVHAAQGLEVDFSTGPSTSTALSLKAILPTNGGDDALTVEGGPVSFALLGIQEGAFGLVDVTRSTVAGRTRAVLAGDGSALTFDGDWAARGVSIHSERLAPEVVRGLDVQLRARGTLTAPGNLRLDDFGATVGGIRLESSGVLDQEADHVAAAFRFEVPTTSCQVLLDSVPTALLPALQATTFAGTFGAEGRFAFDTRSLDNLELEYTVRDQCRVVQVPFALARDRFRQPFVYHVVLPDGSIVEQTTGPQTNNWTPLDQISPYMQVAVLTTEDGGFPRHHGYNHAAIRASIIANLKARRFARGASTITMQLAKNLFLSRDKTLARKLEEVVLTDYLEQTFSKDEIMELYLNVIEFGPAVYGITAAAEYYFGRSPAELNVAECLFLSSLLPAPRRYGTMREAGEPTDGWMRTLHTLMLVANKNGLITDAELADGQNEPVVFWRGGDRPAPRPPVPQRPRPGRDVVDVGSMPDEGGDP